MASIAHEASPASEKIQRASRSYMDLIAAFPLRPIRTDEQLEAASVVMRSLLGIERTIDEDDYLDVLGDLIRSYELEHHPMPPITQGIILRALIDDRGVSQAEVAAGTGIADSNLSAILAGRRGISKAAMIALGKFFRVPPSRFLVG